MQEEDKHENKSISSVSDLQRRRRRLKAGNFPIIASSSSSSAVVLSNNQPTNQPIPPPFPSSLGSGIRAGAPLFLLLLLQSYHYSKGSRSVNSAFLSLSLSLHRICCVRHCVGTKLCKASETISEISLSPPLVAD